MAGLNVEQLIAALGGLGIGGVLLKLLDILAGRRQNVVHADVTISTEARAWVAEFRGEMAAMAARHQEEAAGMSARIDALERRLIEREARIVELETENTKLEREVKRLTRRVADLEKVESGGK